MTPLSPLGTAAALLAVAALLALWALLRPWRVALSVQGRADERSWALAGGLSLGPLAVTGATAAGVAPRGVVSLFGRTLLQLPDPRMKPPEPAKLRALWDFANRHVDLVELGFFLVSERRRVQLHELTAKLSGGLEDPAATAFLAGLCATAAGLLAPFGRLDWEPDWSLTDRGEGALTLVLAASPALLLMDLVSFSFRHVRLRAPAAPQPA